MATKFNLGSVGALPWLAIVTGSTSVEYDAKLDTRTGGEYDRDPEEAGGAVLITQSIGDGGRGSAKLSLPGDSLPDVLDILDNWDPNVESTETLTTAEIVERTLRMEYAEVPDKAPEGTKPVAVAVCFKTSLAPHTRELRIPVADFQGFVGFLREKFVDDNGETIVRAVNHYRAEVAKSEAADKAKADKLAAAAAKASGK